MKTIYMVLIEFLKNCCVYCFIVIKMSANGPLAEFCGVKTMAAMWKQASAHGIFARSLEFDPIHEKSKALGSRT